MSVIFFLYLIKIPGNPLRWSQLNWLIKTTTVIIPIGQTLTLFDEKLSCRWVGCKIVLPDLYHCSVFSQTQTCDTWIHDFRNGCVQVIVRMNGIRPVFKYTVVCFYWRSCHSVHTIFDGVTYVPCKFVFFPSQIFLQFPDCIQTITTQCFLSIRCVKKIFE